MVDLRWPAGVWTNDRSCGIQRPHSRSSISISTSTRVHPSLTHPHSNHPKPPSPTPSSHGRRSTITPVNLLSTIINIIRILRTHRPEKETVRLILRERNFITVRFAAIRRALLGAVVDADACPRSECVARRFGVAEDLVAFAVCREVGAGFASRFAGAGLAVLGGVVRVGFGREEG